MNIPIDRPAPTLNSLFDACWKDELRDHKVVGYINYHLSSMVFNDGELKVSRHFNIVECLEGVAK